MADTRRELSALQTLLADNTAGDIIAQDARDVLISESPSFIHPTSAYASIPATPVTGDIWLPNDGVYLKRYSGSAFVPWGPLFPFTEPISGDFAWINQGSATVSAVNGGVYIESPETALYNWRIRKKAAPSTPYTIVVAYSVQLNPFVASAAAYNIGGVGWRQSSDGKLVLWQPLIATSNSADVVNLAAVRKYTDATNYSSDYALARGGTAIVGPLIFVKLSDDGTNRKIFVSSNGQNFIEVHTVGRTDFITANEVCFAITGTSTLGMHVFHWKEA